MKKNNPVNALHPISRRFVLKLSFLLSIFFPFICFLQLSPPKPLAPLLYPYVLRIPPNSLLSISSPEQYLVNSTDYDLYNTIISISLYSFLLTPKYSPQHHILKHNQPTFLLPCKRPSFTPIQNNRQNYTSACPDL
jgi:hypothetical protein